MRLFISAVSIFVLLFIASCFENTDGDDGALVNQKVTIKDKSDYSKLQEKVPDNFANEGWQRKEAEVTLVSPNDLPAKKPDNNTVYYSAGKKINKERTIDVVFGNITKEKDAIVNAASTDLEGGGGVDGAIHTAAEVKGKDLMKLEAIAYKKQKGIEAFPVGSAMVVNPYGLAPGINIVVLTVGPRPEADKAPTPKNNLELYSAVYNSLLKASEYGAKSVSIPPISAGIFGFPLADAVELYYKAALQYFSDHPNTSIEHIRFISNEKPKVLALANQFLTLFPK